VHRQPESPVEHGRRPLALLLHFGLRVRGATRALLFEINVGVLLVLAMAVKTMLLRKTVVQAMVLRTWLRNVALVVGGSDRVRDVVVVSRTWAMVHVLMLVLLRDVEREIIAGRDALLGGRVVLVHVGHVENGHKSNSCQRR